METETVRWLIKSGHLQEACLRCLRFGHGLVGHSMNEGSALTIVVAEDDPDDRLLIEDAFEESGAPGEVHFVGDGEELLQYLRREASWSSLEGKPLPALVLLDLNMPRLDGREALKSIKSDNQLCVIPIVVMTTSKAEEDVEESYKAGVNSFLSKPRSFEELLNIVQTLERYWMDTVRLPATCVGRAKDDRSGT